MVKAAIPSKLNLIIVQAETEKVEKRTYASNAVPSNAVAAIRVRGKIERKCLCPSSSRHCKRRRAFPQRKFNWELDWVAIEFAVSLAVIMDLLEPCWSRNHGDDSLTVCLLAGGRLNDLLTSTGTSSLVSVQYRYRSLLVSGKGTRVGAPVERDVD